MSSTQHLCPVVSRLQNPPVVFWMKTLVFSGRSTGQMMRQLKFTSGPISPQSMPAILFKDKLIYYILTLSEQSCHGASQLDTAVQPSHQRPRLTSAPSSCPSHELNSIDQKATVINSSLSRLHALSCGLEPSAHPNWAVGLLVGPWRP